MALATQLTELVDQISTIIVGKRAQIEDCVACLLAGGHLLIEDVPGVGKTTLAHALAVSLGLRFSRVQFTADLMPQRPDRRQRLRAQQGGLRLPPGPGVRAGAAGRRDQPRRAEDAERAARGDGRAPGHGRGRDPRRCPQPFFVIATQNPSDQLGTYPLPEIAARPLPDAHHARLPRPRQRARAARRRRPARGDPRACGAVMTPARAGRGAAGGAGACTRPTPLLDYLQALIAATRSRRAGSSRACRPRAGIARAARGQGARAARRSATTSRPTTCRPSCRRPSRTGCMPVAGAGRGRRRAGAGDGRGGADALTPAPPRRDRRVRAGAARPRRAPRVRARLPRVVAERAAAATDTLARSTQRNIYILPTRAGWRSR